MQRQSDKLVEDVLREESVKVFCESPVVGVFRSTTMELVVDVLRSDSGGCVVVVEGEGQNGETLNGDGASHGPPAGIFTERDYLDKLATLDDAAWNSTKQQPIENFMTSNPQSVHIDDRLDQVILLMTRRGYRHLPIVDEDGALVGIVSARDIIGYLAEFFPMEVYNLPPATNQDQMFDTREGG